MTDPVYVTLEEIARLMEWKLSYTKKRASEQKWRRIGRAPTRYSLLDATRGRYRH